MTYESDFDNHDRMQINEKFDRAEMWGIEGIILIAAFRIDSI